MQEIQRNGFFSVYIATQLMIMITPIIIMHLSKFAPPPEKERLNHGNID